MREELEALIDKTSLLEVLDCISEICQAKAEHISSNWQDRDLARLWERAGNRLSGFSAKYTNLPNIGGIR